MQSRSLPPILVALLVAIALINTLANHYFWYWTMRWFDAPMHFAGGIWLAGMMIWLRFFSGRMETISKSLKAFIVWGVGAAFLAGLAWEVYEGVVSLITRGHLNAVPDTFSDLSFDILGGLVVAVGLWMAVNRK